MTPIPLAYRLLVLIGIAVLAGPVMARAEDGGRETPQVHALDRYAPLWSTPWFQAPVPVGTVAVAHPQDAAFPYQLIGLASLDGRSLVYLMDQAGHVVELTYRRPIGDCSLVQIIHGRTEADSMVYVRQGERVISLKFTGLEGLANLTLPSFAKPSQEGASHPTLGRTVKTTYGYARHRTPGAIPVPPPRPGTERGS